MEVREDFKEIIKEIQENGKEFKMSPREFLSYFHCEKRTKGNKGRIDNFLEANNLETVPNYVNVWIDGEVTLKHKPKAKSKSASDPIQRINILPSANKPPVTIHKDAKLSDAITIMMMHNYSQLPVMNTLRSIAGAITWETIGYGITNGKGSEYVRDFIETDVTILKLNTPLLEAIKTVISKEFVLVQRKDQTLSGIVTIADISTQFLSLTEPFLLLEQIENLIRLLLDDKFLVEDIKAFSEDEGLKNDIHYIDDLTFGQYIRLIEKPSNWKKLNLKIERSPFVKQLDLIRQIRNDIMHFDPEGITTEQRQALVNMAKFLTDISKYY